MISDWRVWNAWWCRYRTKMLSVSAIVLPAFRQATCQIRTRPPSLNASGRHFGSRSKVSNRRSTNAKWGNNHFMRSIEPAKKTHVKLAPVLQGGPWITFRRIDNFQPLPPWYTALRLHDHGPPSPCVQGSSDFLRLLLLAEKMTFVMSIGSWCLFLRTELSAIWWFWKA